MKGADTVKFIKDLFHFVQLKVSFTVGFTSVMAFTLIGLLIARYHLLKNPVMEWSQEYPAYLEKLEFVNYMLNSLIMIMILGIVAFALVIKYGNKKKR